MTDYDIMLLRKLGIIITETEYTHNEIPCGMQQMRYQVAPVVNVRGTFYLDESVFRPMCRLIQLTDMIAESKNPVVNEMYEHLVTMLNLTKEEKK